MANNITAHAARVVAVVPAYNETSVLREVVHALLQYPCNVVVIDDGSEPSLGPMLKDMNIYYLRHRANLGQGAALQTGFDFARGLQPDYIISFDADGQHDVAAIEILIQPLIDGEADVVLGSRFLEAGTSRTPLSRIIVLQLARAVNFLFAGLWLSDAHNGLRAFNNRAIEQMRITENRMAHASEILFQIKKQQLRFKEVPVNIHYTHYSKQKGQSGWNSIRILFDLILHKLFK